MTFVAGLPYPDMVVVVAVVAELVVAVRLVAEFDLMGCTCCPSCG